MIESTLQITQVGLAEDGIEIGFVQFPEDVRKNGLVFHNSVFIPRGSDYDDEIETFEDALRALLEDAFEDRKLAPHIEPTDDEDDEEEEGEQ